MRRFQAASPLAASLLLLLALAQLQCGGEDTASTSAAPAEPPVLTATEAIESGALAARFPEDGIRIERTDELLTVFARDVARFDVLQRLAVRYRFELDDWSAEDPIVDVFVENVALEVALARLIEPTPYRLSYERAADSETNVVRHLEVGTPPEKSKDDRAASEQGADEEKDAEQRARRRYRRATEAETRAALEARELRQERRREEALAESEAADEQTRLDAVEFGLDASDAASRDRLLDIALDDPSPLVRAAAASGLSHGDAPIGLIRAVDDPDAKVVIAAIEALSWLDDPDALDAIKRRLHDPNPDIDQAARNGVLDSRAAD